MSDPLKDYPKGLVSAINDVLSKQNDLYSAGLMQKYGIEIPSAEIPAPVESEDLGQEVSAEVQDVISDAEVETSSEEEENETDME